MTSQPTTDCILSIYSTRRYSIGLSLESSWGHLFLKKETTHQHSVNEPSCIRIAENSAALGFEEARVSIGTLGNSRCAVSVKRVSVRVSCVVVVVIAWYINTYVHTFVIRTCRA